MITSGHNDLKEVLRGEARRRASLWVKDEARVRTEQEQLNKRLTEFLLQQSEPGDGIALFAGRGAELRLEATARSIHAEGRVVYLPRILTRVKEGAKMGFAPVIPGGGEFKEWDLELQAWGIPEPPQADVSVLEGDAQGKLTWLVLPCLLGDEDYYRVGHGGGYYDRFTASLRSQGRPCRFMLPRLSWQISEEALPRDPWDIPADIGLTVSAPPPAAGTQSF